MNEDFAQARTTDFKSIPVVDLEKIDDDEGFAAIADNLVSTAETIGFFYIKNHGIPEPLIEQAFEASKSFFALPVEKKATIAVDKNQRGWMGTGMAKLEGSKTHDAKEVFFWGYDVAADDPDYLAGLPMVAPNQWPEDVAPFLQRDLLPYYAHVLELSRKVLAALSVGLGKDRNFFEAAYQKPLGRGQLVYYPPMTEADEKQQRFGAAAHTDFGVLTILLQDMQGGLQVMNKAGDWIEAPPIAGTFVCNIGDLLERWTNGRLVSTRHRVINRSGAERYSIPVFCDPASDTPIDPSAFGSDDTNYEIITAGEHISNRNRNNFTQYKDDKSA